MMVMMFSEQHRISNLYLIYTEDGLVALKKEDLYTIYVTEFAKRGLIHASNFSTLRICNSAYVWTTALKLSSRTFLSL